LFQQASHRQYRHRMKGRRLNMIVLQKADPNSNIFGRIG